MSPKSNLHSHTPYCDGRAEMADMIAAARDAGFVNWGFSPHAPICVDSPCNMTEADVPAYKAEVERLRTLYPDMTILAGMEVDYIDADHGPASAAVEGYGLDYVIGSVHFVPNQAGVPIDIDGSPEHFRERLATEFGGDLDYVVRTFWSQTMKMIEAGGFDIIGHIDKVARNATTVRPLLEQEPEYRAAIDAAVDAAIESGCAIEINTKQRASAGRYFPHPRHWAHIARAGVVMPIDSDAHTTDAVDAGMADAADLFRVITEMDANDAERADYNGSTALRTLDRATALALLADPAGLPRQLYAETATPYALQMLEGKCTVDYGRLDQPDKKDNPTI